MKTPINLNIDDLLTPESNTVKLIQNALNNNNFIQPVIVQSVNIENLTVDIKPLILRTTTDEKVIENNIIYNVKFARIQSGKSAIVIDPTVGDIGLALICDKDISTINATKQEAVSPSLRSHSFSDSVYLGGFLNQNPKQYVKFTDEGIEIYSPTKITAIAPQISAECDTLQAQVEGDTLINSNRILLSADSFIDLTAPAISLNGALTSSPLNGGDVATLHMPLTSTEEITAKDVSLSTHVHSGVMTGDYDTGKPK